MSAETRLLRSEIQTTSSFTDPVGHRQRVCDLMPRTAKSHVTVLVRGESGPGNENPFTSAARALYTTISRERAIFGAGVSALP